MGKKKKKESQKSEGPAIRTPIVCVLGHVDHGKTSLLDWIRGSSVTAGEAGAITQHIGATIVPLDAIQKMSGTFEKLHFNVPGLLFIDTPGHHAFTTLRARGGALADMAILVVDINEGFQPQTIEALEILRTYRTPFVVAATKIDRIHGWRVNENAPFRKTFETQGDRVKMDLENKTYELIGTLSEKGFNCERFDRVSDFAKNIAIVPVSGVTGEGVPDLLLMLIGLAQRYMTEALEVSVEGPGAGTVLEVKEERGLGMTLDVILYDGTLSVGDEVAIATSDGVVNTKIRSLLKPRPMSEILVEEKFERVKSVTAASGIKVAAPKLENVIAGSPLRAIPGPEEIDAINEEVRREVEEIHVDLSEEGIFIKADTIGALEALAKELEGHGIKIMKAEVGPVSRHDLIEVETIKEPLNAVLLAFNTPLLPDAVDILKHPTCKISVFVGDVIYKLIDDYTEWVKEQKRKIEAQRFEQIILPAKITILEGCIFRQSNPAVVGIRVLGGKLRSGVKLMRRDGKAIGQIKTIQVAQENVPVADAGAEVAVSIEGVTVGRQINEKDDLYAYIPENHVKVLETEMISTLNPGMREVLEEYTTIRRKDNPFWGK
ncbi:translation initiation factor IF-2 [Methanofollis aquaemaris]|uniref:Probable translation initiation factor IF-2 n=1 Tax=Methanofollis aquaemaris TaxID=126734 RepID=A0A8A3S4J3_9EURY|nr:translation initiation factor IF-2 [Methanofollis aquaemaris]QSZ67045.1 translation initiation factor IF-2 [Methanofollis aquaemaris]